MNKRPLLGNGSVNMTITIDELLTVVFHVGSAPRLHNEDPRPAERTIKRKFRAGSRERRRKRRESAIVE
jgi:hypothetical protein